jgi:hypothetical protein
MKHFINYAYALYLGVASAIVGIYFPSWDYVIVNVPTIVLVGMATAYNRTRIINQIQKAINKTTEV